jgi:hypothetical protein
MALGMRYDYCGEEDKSLPFYHNLTLSVLGRTKKTPMNLESMFRGRYKKILAPIGTRTAKSANVEVDGHVLGCQNEMVNGEEDGIPLEPYEECPALR